MRLIDADALKANINGWYRFMTEIGHAPKFTLGQEDIIAKIDNQPTQQQPCEDAISREEAFKELRKVKHSQEFCAEHNIDDSINLEMANIAISNLPSVQPKSSWISVDERLPQNKEFVWITDIEGNVHQGMFLDGEEKIFALRLSIIHIEHVKAWMPINKPEPYKEENK